MFRVIFCFFVFFFVFIYNLGATSILEAISEADYDKKKAELGKALFFDKRLSNEGHSCQTCHHLVGELTGTTTKFPSPPSILNSSLNYYFKENGDISSLKKQIENMFFDADAYNTTPQAYIQRVLRNPKYQKLFKEIYGKVSFDNALDALNEFIIALRSPSRFDRFLSGDDEALSSEEKEGYQLFVRLGCIACHNGSNLGGGMLAVIKNQDGSTSIIRVPSLRNVKKTGPWMRFSSTNLLSSILWLQNSVIDTKLKPVDIIKIITFFDALNADIPSILENQELGDNGDF